MRQRDRRKRERGSGIPLACMALLLLLGACSLEVNDLPENSPPVVGEILMDPPFSELAPLDSFNLSVSAEDVDGDPLAYVWSATIGSWADGNSRDSSVVWVAPASFGEEDSVTLGISVRDLEEADPILRDLAFPVINRQGHLRVRVFDLAGEPVAVPLAVVGIETTTVAVSEWLFSDLDWGDQIVLSFETADHHGAGGGFVGYPDTVYIEPDLENLLEIKVAPTSLLLIPGKFGDAVFSEIQAGIDYCAEQGIDSLLLRAGDYDLPMQTLPTDGSAALRLDAGDLLLAPFPGEGPIVIDAAQGGNDFGLYLKGRGPSMRVEGLIVSGAASSGACLHQSSGEFADMLFENCGAAGVFVLGGETDTLRLDNCVLRGNDHGLSMSGGVLNAEGLLVEDSGWYGLWFRDGAMGSMDGSTVVNSELAAVFLDAGVVSLAHNILAENGRGIFRQDGATPILDCNLLWANEYGDYSGLSPEPSDLLEDPLFCDPELGDWRVDAESPALNSICAPQGAFGDCGSDGGPYLPDVEVK